MSLQSRPPTPDSPMSRSLQRATNTIDDLTLALANFSRIASPEPPDTITCCCGKEDCETSRTWSAWKVKMESRLILSAEVGQALLERHEAYVRRHEAAQSSPPNHSHQLTSSGEQVDARIADLVKENAVLEKRLTQALVNNEVAESSNKSTVQQLQEAQSNVARLTVHQARSIGWENRLAVALQEKDDLQQERDSAAQRVKLAEARINALKDKCVKLQAQVMQLREDLDIQRMHRQELSEEVLSDARQRLAQLQQSQPGPAGTNDAEVTKVLESLVADNETLKRDNAELQNLLTESREDSHALQVEVRERRAGDSSYLRHRYTDSGDSSNFHEASRPLSPAFHVGTMPTASPLRSWHRRADSGATSSRRAASAERSMLLGLPMSPETNRRPLSPADSSILSERKLTSFARPYYARSHHSYEVETDNKDADRPLLPERTRAQKSTLLLTRSRGVQTEGAWDGSGLVPSPVPHSFGDHLSSSTPQDGRSESSSLIYGQSSAISTLIERVTLLLNRITQADAFTLTNRLKRQRLLGADVSHLSRTTVSGILHEAATLRAHFRSFLEDEKATMTCTRRDLRTLFKLFKDVFAEMGQMRVTLNDVILDPSVAAKVSDMAMHPAKTASGETGGSDSSGGGAISGWMAPISRLLGLPGGNASDSAATRALSPPARLGARSLNRVPSRIVPKREAALSASAMTVNVEFSGTAVGRSVTSTYSAHPERKDSISILDMQSLLDQPIPVQNVSKSVMGIFAGAPRAEDGFDPWIVVPKPQRGGTIPNLSTARGTAMLGRGALRHARGSRYSRTVDAVIDSSAAQNERREEQDVVAGTLLDRTLSRRGLSDSSIHTTFMNHGEVQGSSRRSAEEQASSPTDRNSVLQALSKRMQTFRFAGSGSNVGAEAGASVSRPDTPAGASSADGRQAPTGIRASSPRAMAPVSTRLFSSVNLSSWAAAALDPSHEPSSYLAGSPREEAFVHRTWARERDFE